MKTKMLYLQTATLAVNLLASTAPLRAQLIFLKSDATTQAAATTNLAVLDTGNTAGLTFQPAFVGSYGSWTPVPMTAPSGTEVINIPPGASEGKDGQHGFFRILFTLPVLGPNALLTGVANVDDRGRVFLNGKPISPSMTTGDPNTITEFGDHTFWSTSLDEFHVGYNELLISDWNFGAGPSGAAFYAVIYPAGAIQWAGGPGNWTNVIQWSPALPSTNAWVLLPDDSEVLVDAPDAQTGGLTVNPSATLTVQNGGNLVLTGPAVNHGTMDIGAGGQVCLGCGTGGGGVGFQQNGTLNVGPGGQVLSGTGSSSGYGMSQSSGWTLVNGTLSVGGAVQVQGGDFTVASGGTVSAGIGIDALNSAFDQSGGVTTVNGTLNVGSHVYNDGGTVIISPGGSVNQEPLAHEVAHVAQSRGVTTINGTLNLPLNVDGGTVNGSGTINGNAGINGGVLSPGNSPGTLTVSNDFALNDGGTLLIELAGRETNQFDLLKVGGSAGLAGGLIVRVLPGFAPAIGDQFPILTTAERSGEFSRLEVPPGIAVTYNPTGVVLVVTSAVHVQIMGPALSGGDLVFSFATATNQSYTVQFNDDLATTNWLLQTNLTGTGSLLYFTSPVTNAPQRFFRVRQP